MKKLYRKGTVHPSPPVISDHLSFLPATILTLTVALSPEDREVLAYLISCSNNSSNNFHGPKRNTNNHNHKITTSCTDHHPLFNCDCFGCYMSYWVRWDLSPNRQLIHEIIDAFEDGLFQNKKMKSKKERRNNNNNNKRGCNNNNNDGSVSELSLGKEKLSESGSVEETTSGGVGGGGEEGTEKGSVRKLVSFIGERIWGGVWY